MAALVVFDLLGVAMGLEGIQRLRAFGYPPFLRGGGMYMFLGPIWFPPNWLVLAWDSALGRVLLWAGCVTIPLCCGVLAFTQRRFSRAFMVMLGWTLASGVVGIWIWLDAIFNAADLR